MDPTGATARVLGRRPTEVDALLVGLVAVAQLVGTPLAAHHHLHTPVRELDGLAWVLLVAGVVIVPFRHRAPALALGGAFLTTAAYAGLGYSAGPVWAPLIICLAQCLVVGRRRIAWASLAVGFVTFLWLPEVLGNGSGPRLAAVLGLGAWLITLASIIELLRLRRERSLEQARVAAETLRRQASEERLRIARELHDAVAHSMSLINIQAGVALHLIDERPEQAQEALATIKGASKDALVELRSILGVLRQVDEDEPRAPTPSLDRLDELVRHAALSGVEVRLDLHGDLHHLPTAVDLAAYRIVQESLTNVARHADRPDAIVRIRAAGEVLSVEVLDEGAGTRGLHPDLPSGGNGIAGMRERASSVGGRLSAGPRAGRGFAVRAELPIGGRR